LLGHRGAIERNPVTVGDEDDQVCPLLAPWRRRRVSRVTGAVLLIVDCATRKLPKPLYLQSGGSPLVRFPINTAATLSLDLPPKHGKASASHFLFCSSMRRIAFHR
jgi:hypothetical protein